MSLFDLIIIAIGLSMDAFAVSICKGLSVPRIGRRHVMAVGLYFGGFQALMPVIGYLLGRQFEGMISGIDHWIAFLLLAVIGGNMAREAISSDEDDIDSDSASFGPKSMLPLAVATSIDALAVGVTFAFLGVNIVPAVTVIGLTTFALSAGGLHIGHSFGTRYKSKSELAGGIILICLGGKILVEHLFFGG